MRSLPAQNEEPDHDEEVDDGRGVAFDVEDEIVSVTCTMVSHSLRQRHFSTALDLPNGMAAITINDGIQCKSNPVLGAPTGHPDAQKRPKGSTPSLASS